jgi:hypothetical protein
MRNGQNNKHRMRGRNRSGGKSHNPLTRVYESNGPDVKIRGTANHVAEKYIQLARDATASGDPVAAENYYQHAEHYFRLIAAAQEQFRQSPPFPRTDGGEQRSDESYDDGDDSQPAYGSMEPHTPRDQQQFQPREQQGYQQRDQSYQQRDHQQGNYQPRENRENRDNRHDNRQYDNRNEGRQHENRQHESRPQENRQHESRPQENRQYDRQPQPNNGGPEEDLGLPSFITGAPPQGAGQPNGHEGQGDRFPLHRRRRRGHRSGRPDMAGGSEGGDESAQGQPPSNE